MQDLQVVSGDVVIAKYYAYQQRTTKKKQDIYDYVEKRGCFVIINTQNKDATITGLIILKNKEGENERPNCCAFSPTHYTILDLCYHLHANNIEEIMYHMGDEYIGIVNGFNQCIRKHLVHVVGEKRKISKGRSDEIRKNAFHMSYTPTTSIHIVRG